MIRTLARLIVTAIVALIATVAIGQATASAAPAAGDPTPQTCRTEGNHMCGSPGPYGPRPDGSCPTGGTPATGGLGNPVCRYSGSSSSSGGSSHRGSHRNPPPPPIVIEGVNHNVAPLSASYVDPSYSHTVATRESVFGTAGAYGGSHP